ncbi:MAG: capsular polysaccharide biosynthesis protein CapF [Clostridiaceae bacterium]|nr:capsular polysaccharide biosynthesis protein CapF [Clostridiaceae bacterium]
MNILVTGAKGFVGKNLCESLKNIRDEKDKTTGLGADLNIFEYDIDADPALLDEYCKKADFVFNLAGVNRPKEESEFTESNFGFVSRLLDTLKRHGNRCPVMLSSSTQAERENPYGLSKKAGEDLFFEYEKESGARVLVYRFPNVFGKWCRPNYNSAVATFCHNIARGLPITVNDPKVMMTLVYIDDVVAELIRALKGEENRADPFCAVSVVHRIELGGIVELLYSFRASREERAVPLMSDAFTAKLYATYLSYLPKVEFAYPLKMNCDQRGSFTEMIRTPERGQISVNISKPGITKGNHWHHTKNEKFIVVSGRGVIRFRKIGETEVIEYPVSGDEIRAVDIPTGYTHNITNTGDTDMITVMWASECFDPDHPDTFYEEV